MVKVTIALVAIGVLGGIAAGLWQLEILPWGAIASDQLARFWAFFVGAGALLALGGGAAGALLALALRFARRLLPTLHFLERPALELPLFGAFLVLGGFFWMFVPKNVRHTPPDVFLFVTDTTRADHVSVYGYERETTPFLEELSGRSIVFTNSVSQGSHTIVSTPCILASCYPSEHGLTDYRDILSEDFQLISEVLNEAGYYTFALVTNPHVNARVGFDQGFEHFESMGSGTSSAVLAEDVNRRALEILDRHLDSRQPQEELEGSAETAKDAQVADVEGVDSTAVPIFGFVFYTDPHAPYISPSHYQRLFDPGWVQEKFIDRWSKSKGRPSERDLFNMIAQYDGTIAYWDSELEKFLGELEERVDLSNALLVYTSDHGEEFFEHDEYGHEHALYEESVRVPLLISFPVPIRFPPLKRTSRRVNEVVSSVDLLPTVLDYLRLPIAESARGSSVLDYALGRGDSKKKRVVYLEEILKRYGPYDLRAVRTRDRKFIFLLNYRGQLLDVDEMLFDLLEDPNEEENLLTERPEEAELFRDLLATRINEAAVHAISETEKLDEVDEGRLQQLRALGYID